MKLTREEQNAVRIELEERADYITDDELLNSTATNDFFDEVQRKLVGRGTKLVVGPRGCGKTHMMRYAQLSCVETKSAPFAVYVSFNRYYRLEPMLQSKTDAIRLFQIWTLANILVATAASAKLFAPTDTEAFAIVTGFNTDDLAALIGHLETATPLEQELDDLAQDLTVSAAVLTLEKSTARIGRRRCILLLDDAALTLTPDYLVEFFDIVRTIKTATISPKASVYPGTTEYGPRFHAKQEAEEVPVWLSPEDPGYEHMMQAIAAKRFSGFDRVSADIVEQLKYAAFGIPRAYLSMLRKFIETSAGTSQQSLNATIDEHMTARLSEFQSLAKKVPRFESLVEVGQVFFRRVVELLRDANLEETEGSSRQLLFGLLEEPGHPLRERMLSLLLEAGLLYEHPKVSHGEDRKYRRFTPHLAALMQHRAFSGRHRGVSPKRVIEFLRRPQAKHPLRRTLNKVLTHDELQNIRLSLPPCAQCNTARMSENQRFCHQCGAELLAASTFANYLQVSLVDVPGFTEWQRKKIREFTNLRTIGDLLAYQDPGSELRKIPWVGKTRARNMIDLVNAHVDEFFS
jgi:hypothetical protein